MYLIMSPLYFSVATYFSSFPGLLSLPFFSFLSFLTLGAHAQRGLLLVCLCVCVCVCLSVRSTKVRSSWECTRKRIMRNRAQFHPHTYVPAVGARSTESDLMHTLCTCVVTRGARKRYAEIPCGRKYAIRQYMIMHTFCITKTLKRTLVLAHSYTLLLSGQGHYHCAKGELLQIVGHGSGLLLCGRVDS